MDLEHPRLSHYRLERELGRGFSSIVYEATDERRPRAVALKVLTFLQTLSEDRRVDLAKRFRREAQAVSILSHPNIVAIYEVGHTDDGRQYIAMECLPGETLRQRLHRSSPLSVPEAVAIAVRVADALHYAHGRGIVHRDIKPDNIFLAKGAGLEVMPKLMDFGIAHVLSDQGLTQDGTIVGSPAYMSPEQINGQPLDARTDIFSLAVTLTEMITGAKPFEGDSIPAVMQQILRHTPDLRAVPDRRLERVLTKALSKHPSARYPSAAAFAEALRQAAPLAVAAPSVATQIMTEMPRRAAAAFPMRGSARLGRYARLGAVGVGGMALAALAAFPLVTKRPAAPVYAAVPASRPSPQPVPPAAPVRFALGLKAQRHEVAAAWHPAKPRSIHSAHNPATPAHDVGMVRIAEVTPIRHHFSYYAHSARIPFAAHPPKSSLTPTPPPPAVFAASDMPRMASADLAPPIVRVAGVRQELPPAGKTAQDAIPEAEPASDGEISPPPRAQSTKNLDNAPPRPVHCPMPPALAAIDDPSAVIRLRLSVDENGDVMEATILTSTGSRVLDDAALDAVGHWEYDPAVKNGRSVPGVVIETVRFSRRQ